MALQYLAHKAISLQLQLLHRSAVTHGHSHFVKGVLRKCDEYLQRLTQNRATTRIWIDILCDILQVSIGISSWYKWLSRKQHVGFLLPGGLHSQCRIRLLHLAQAESTLPSSFSPGDVQVINGESPVGVGASSTVYRGLMAGSLCVAVKCFRLNLSKIGDVRMARTKLSISSYSLIIS